MRLFFCVFAIKPLMGKMKNSSITSFIFLMVLVMIENVTNDYVLKEVDVISEGGRPVKIFSAEEMQSYDGSDDSKPIYIGIKGVVFDVSSGKRFYGKDSPYNTLVGKDSTRATAKMSLEVEDLTHDITDLSGDQLKSLDEIFEGTYVAKYPIVGYMDYLLTKYPSKFAHLKTEL